MTANPYVKFTLILRSELGEVFKHPIKRIEIKQPNKSAIVIFHKELRRGE